MLLSDASTKTLLFQVSSLRFLTREERASINAFVIMNNHFHMIWQMIGVWDREKVQRDFLKYTGQSILAQLKFTGSAYVEKLHVQAADREYQFWERNSRGVSLTTERFLVQKLNCIHNKPVKAGLCTHPEDYKYSSARFYVCNEKNWDFLVHYKG